MPTESDSKVSSESHKPAKSWLAKCGIAIPILVRERQGSQEDPNRLVMTVADSPKKRKRVASPHDKRDRISIQHEESKHLDMASSEVVRAFFDEKVGDTQEVNAYSAAHRQLLQLENEDAWDREAKPRSTSRSKDDQAEIRATFIIRSIREYERRVTFGNLASEAIPGPDTRDMGGQFLTNKQRIDHESILYQIAKQVPKGCLLHLHFNAELHPERLLERAQKIDNIYIRSIQPLTSRESLDETEMVFNVLDPNQVVPNVNIFAEDYQGTATNWRQDEFKWKIWMKWKDFQKEFIDRFGEEFTQKPLNGNERVHACSEPGNVELNPAENWLKSKMVLSKEEAYAPNQTVNGVWARFNQATRCFKGLLNYEDVYKWYIGEAIQRMIDEKVMYAELRPMLLDKFIPTTDGTGKIDNPSQMRLIIEGVRQKQEELRENKQLDKFPFGLKIVYCTPRSIPKKMMQEEMKQCIELKIQFPDLICGFDLVGAEDRPNHIGFYKEELVAFRKTCEARGLEIPFLFHAGETLLDTGGSTDPENSNLYDAVILNSKRIGHGFALMKHPHLVEKFKKTKTSPGICVELCPISNELLHLCRNIKEHPFPELLAAGIPCTVNSDNPSLFSNSMSHEFYQIMVGAPTMSLASWKQLARWSIDYSCLNDEQKKEAHKIFAREWKSFCHKVVEDYGKLFVGDTLDETEAAEEYEQLKQSSS